MTFDEWKITIESKCRKKGLERYTTVQGFDTQRQIQYDVFNDSNDLDQNRPWYTIFYAVDNDRGGFNILQERFFFETDEHLSIDVYKEKYRANQL